MMKKDNQVKVQLAMQKAFGLFNREQWIFLGMVLGGLLVILFSITWIMNLDSSQNFEDNSDLLKMSQTSKNDAGLETNLNGVSARAGLDDEAGVKNEFFSGEWLWLDIGGAVKKPGIYALPVKISHSNRLFELVEKAGGFTSDVNQSYLAQRLNLAVEIRDGQKIYIPFNNESWSQETVGISQGDKGGGEGLLQKNQAEIANTGQISINQATLKELQTLKGVGEVRANNIVDGRPYQSLEELVEKKILTEKILEDNANELAL